MQLSKILVSILVISLFLPGIVSVFHGNEGNVKADSGLFSDGLVAYWNFDEGTGTIAHDSSGNNYHGTVHNANWTTGILGSGLEFRYTDYVGGISSEFDDTVTSNFTIMSWVYWDPGNTMDNNLIFDARTWGRGFNLKIDNEKFHFRIQTPTTPTTLYWVNSTSTVPVNKWVHVAGIFDDATNKLTIYLNGNMDNTSTVPSPYYETTENPAIGNNHWAPGDGKWAGFNGTIDEIRFYNRSISTAELSAYVNQFLTLVYVDDDYTPSTPGWGYDHFDVIQDGIDAVAVGGTVYVYSGIYYENVFVDKTISLIGEDRTNTIIDGGGTGNVVDVFANWVNISGFRIQNGGTGGHLAGVNINANNSIIMENNITNNNLHGIHVELSSNNHIIMGNIITNNSGDGINHTWSSVVIGNTITNNSNDGIDLHNSNNNNISGNTIKSNYRSIYLHESFNNVINGNTIKSNDYGIRIYYISYNNKIYHNNFIGETCYEPGTSNHWDNGYPSGGNYWNDFDEPSEGAWDNNSDGIVDTPYDISGGSNQDLYPLLEPLECIVLYRGWNMIGWCGDSTTAESLGQNISGCSVVTMFDGATQTFVSHVVGVPHDNFMITQHMGLFIYATEPSVWCGRG